MIDRRAWLKFAAVGAGGALGGGAPAQADSRPPAPVLAVPPATIKVLSPGAGATRYDSALARIGDYMTAHLEGYGLPGMTFCLADQDGFAAIVTAGWANVEKAVPVAPDQLFQIGSISKSLAAICVLKAAAAGKFTLDDPIAPLLPGVPLPPQPITVRQLLIHASGLPADAPFFPRGGEERLWTGFAPGAQFSYSNTGYGLLGLILQRAHQAPYAEILAREALGPLGMTASQPTILYADLARYATGYWAADQDAPFYQGGRLAPAYFTDFGQAAGCVASTPGDMAKYLRFLIGAGAGRGAPLLSDADAKRFTTPEIAATEFGPKARYALGLAEVPVGDRPCLHHTGGMIAFSSSLHVDPAAGVGAFASTNAAIGPYRPRDITAYAVLLMRAARTKGEAPKAPPIKSEQTVEKAADYDGRYESAAGEVLVLKGEGERLMLTYRGETAALRVNDEDAFVAPHPALAGELLVFQREGGRPVSARWGERYFAKDPARRVPPPAPPELAAKAGFYINNDPWAGSATVYARADGLWLQNAAPLISLPDGSYRVGKAADGCERVRFEAPFDGRPQRLVFSGVDHLRLADNF